MEGHRAVIIGAGRIGCGFKWPAHSFVYTHADAYQAMAHRVQLVGVVEPDQERAAAAEKKYGVHVYSKIGEAIGVEEADIVSVCVQPKDQASVMSEIPDTVKGIWLEKPCVGTDDTRPIQVNYIRRFERIHIKAKQLIEQGKLGKPVSMVVQAKADEHTICHFADLSLYFGVPVDKVQYADTAGTNYVVTNYVVMLENGVISFSEGGSHYAIYSTKASKVFPGVKVAGGLLAQGDWEPHFMEAALKNLLDVVEDEKGEKTLLSPPDLEVNERTNIIAGRFKHVGA